MSAVLFCAPVAMLLLGMPIFVVLLAAVSVTLVHFMNVPLAALHQNLFAGANSYALLAVPFFIYAGEIMVRGSVAARLVDFVRSGVGATTGSLPLTTIGASTIFGAISGASAATVATVGKVMHPTMIDAGYPRRFAAGLVTSVGAIDIVIPPSIPMIVYGITAQQSVPRLYAAGVLPGLLIAALLATYVVWFSRRHGITSGRAFSLPMFTTALKRGLAPLGAPLLVLGGIYGGLFSPTEAAAVACAYAIVVTLAVFRELNLRDVLDAASTTAQVTGQILIIAACANVLAWLLTVNQVPASLVSWMVEVDIPTWLLLLGVNVLLLLAGCLIDPISAILMLSPLLLPVVTAAGVDPIHFGVILTVNLAIGLFSPPFGINIFVAQSVLRLPLRTIYEGLLPFFLIYLVALGLVTWVPQLSMFGVSLLFQ